jgi:hypothetical protein
MRSRRLDDDLGFLRFSLGSPRGRGVEISERDRALFERSLS